MLFRTVTPIGNKIGGRGWTFVRSELLLVRLGPCEKLPRASFAAVAADGTAPAPAADDDECSSTLPVVGLALASGETVADPIPLGDAVAATSTSRLPLGVVVVVDGRW